MSVLICTYETQLKDAANFTVISFRNQVKARRKKEELAKQKNMDKATEDYTEVLYLISIYNSDRAAYSG